jgi:crotonobetainyl-CoA:carnitine CoA-transferase CaiB-like acyl-CoA transferase
VAKADVFIQNLAPGAAARLGFDCAELRERYPRLITCSISGYGEEGPLKELKAYDLLVQAESGLAALTGSPDAPGRSGVSICDIGTGMYAYQAILEALIGRAKTGEGRAIALSLYHAMADWMNVPFLQYAYGGYAPQRVGLTHPTIAPYGLFTCADGKALLISVQSEREWASLCRLMGRPDLEDEPRFASNVERVRHRREVDAIVAAWLGAQPRAHYLPPLAEARIAYGRLSDMDDVLAHPQNRQAVVATAVGEVRLMAPPAIVAGEERKLGAVPALGAHSQAIRREFGG